MLKRRKHTAWLKPGMGGGHVNRRLNLPRQSNYRMHMPFILKRHGKSNTSKALPGPMQQILKRHAGFAHENSQSAVPMSILLTCLYSILHTIKRVVCSLIAVKVSRVKQFTKTFPAMQSKQTNKDDWYRALEEGPGNDAYVLPCFIRNQSGGTFVKKHHKPENV